MIPGNAINPSAPLAVFLEPDQWPRWDLLKDYERGSLALGDPSSGLTTANWRVYVEGTGIYVTRFNSETATLVTTAVASPTEVTFAFDSNMRPQVAYVADGQVQFYWYDTAQGAFTTTAYSGITSPRLCLDDKRSLQDAARDLLLLYLKAGDPVTLCYRQQRERYTVERVLMDAPAKALRLGRVGMAVTNRVQIEFILEP